MKTGGNLVQILPPGINPGEADEQLYSFNQRNLLTQYQVGAGSSVYNTLAEYSYDGSSNRLQQIDSSGTTPITTTYTNDNAGLSQVLVSNDGTTTTLNLFGLDLIQQDDGSETRTLLVDGLGSARVEMVGNTVETTTTYEPYGKLLAQTGSSGTTYGFSGEQEDGATGLIYVRARYYNPSLHGFMNRDPWIGNPRQPATQNGQNYANSNPTNLVDPSGLSAENPNCDTWPQVLGVGLRKICQRASGAENDPDTLDAREEIYRTIVSLGSVAGYGLDGMEWASRMLEHYLDGNVGSVHINLPQGHPFTNDTGIRRAITISKPPIILGDEPDEIIPLLHEFLGSVSANCAAFFAPQVYLEGVSADSPNYFLDDPTRPKGQIPRPYDLGYFFAFGHVAIDGAFQATGQVNTSGMFVNYQAQYAIHDRYRWFSNTTTPLPLGINIPHAWALSLESHGRAKPYDFTITWSEQDTVWISPDRSAYFSKDTGSFQPLHTPVYYPHLLMSVELV